MRAPRRNGLLASEKKSEQIRSLSQSSSRAGVAFQSLVKAGVPESWLEGVLLQYPRLYPWERPRHAFSTVGARRLMAIASILEKKAAELKPFSEVVIATGINQQMFFLDRDILSLEIIASHLRHASVAEQNRIQKATVASDIIPSVIQEVRLKTGRPHFAKLAIVLGFSYGKDLSEHELKTMNARFKERQKR